MPHRAHLLLSLTAALFCGCASVPSWLDYPPFVEVDRTDYTTPRMRIVAIREYAARSTGEDTEDQRKITDQLGRQIQIEPDPLVRQAIVETIAEFRTPLALQVLQAGLSDDESAVRIACCRGLGKRGDTTTIASLNRILRSDKDIDVRIAVTESLAGIKSPESIRALSAAVEDRDPALQFVGVQSLKSLSGQDFGGDVAKWRQFASSESPQIGNAPAPSLAKRLRDVTPF